MYRSPRPSASIARRLAKWNTDCVRCAAHESSPVQRATDSPSSRTMSEPQTGHCAGIAHGAASGGRIPGTTAATSGIQIGDEAGWDRGGQELLYTGVDGECKKKTKQ